MRMLPNMTVLCPGDAVEVRLALRAALKHQGPAYIRLGKKNEPVVHKHFPDFVIGRGIVLRKGDDVCLLSTGNLLPIAIQAAEEMESQSVSAQVVSLHTVKPLDEALLGEAFARFKLIATVEEHSLIGGLGGAVSEWIADRPRGRARLLRIAVPDQFIHDPGSQSRIRGHCGLTPESISQEILHALAQKGGEDDE